jgi:hypothetical protein
MIGERDRESIFEQGFTRKPGGRGLGLFISRKVLRREGMDIAVGIPVPPFGAAFLIKWKGIAMPAQTMCDFSYEAARSYLQTAVFVDDRIYETGTGKVVPVTNLEVPVRRKSAFAGGAPVVVSTSPAEASGGEDAKGLFSAQDIVVSFANEGIVCGLYQPTQQSCSMMRQVPANSVWVRILCSSIGTWLAKARLGIVHLISLAR